MDINLVYAWCSKGFPDSTQRRELCGPGWEPEPLPTPPLRPQRTLRVSEAAESKQNISLMSKKKKKGGEGDLVNAACIIQNPR